MRGGTLQIWVFAHKWSSLISTVFLLLLCLTGLPLIFHDEIEAALNPDEWRAANPDGPRLGLDEILAVALKNRPGESPIYMSFDVTRPVINVTTGPRADGPVAEMRFASFDATSGALVPPSSRGEAVMEFIFRLHTDLFLGLPGMLFLGVMGLLLAVSIISGVVLYAPFMRKLAFGTLRRDKSPRVKWLDYHNLLGIVTTGWLLLVGLTGVINALEKPIVSAWRAGALADLMANTKPGGDPARTGAVTLERVVAGARAEAPDMRLQFIAFPGSDFAAPGHYAIFFHGKTPATERIITPVLVNAANGASTGPQAMPWFMQALSLSRPLHFGDYGGLFLKIVWALLDLAAIIILLSGLYLWSGKTANPPQGAPGRAAQNPV